MTLCRARGAIACGWEVAILRKKTEIPLSLTFWDNWVRVCRLRDGSFLDHSSLSYREVADDLKGGQSAFTLRLSLRLCRGQKTLSFPAIEHSYQSIDHYIWSLSLIGKPDLKVCMILHGPWRRTGHLKRPDSKSHSRGRKWTPLIVRQGVAALCRLRQLVVFRAREKNSVLFFLLLFYLCFSLSPRRLFDVGPLSCRLFISNIKHVTHELFYSI